MCIPEYPWHRLRKEAPGEFESYTDLRAGEWTKIRIEVVGSTAKLFVDDANQPCLLINQLKKPPRSGAIALWIGSGTDGHFANLKITKFK